MQGQCGPGGFGFFTRWKTKLAVFNDEARPAVLAFYAPFDGAAKCSSLEVIVNATTGEVLGTEGGIPYTSSNGFSG